MGGGEQKNPGEGKYTGNENTHKIQQNNFIIKKLI